MPHINPDRSDEPLHEGPEGHNEHMDSARQDTLATPASVGEAAVKGVRREPIDLSDDNLLPEASHDSKPLTAPTHSTNETAKSKAKGKGKGRRESSESKDPDSGQYFNEIGLTPLLTADEERNLSQTIEKGRKAQARLDAGEQGQDLQRAVRAAANAKDRFIRANLRLVVSVAKRYSLPPGMELLDLIQEGNLALLEPIVDNFDWRKGFRFSTYGEFCLSKAIGRAISQKASLVRLPVYRSASLRSALGQVGGDGDKLDNEHARLHRLTTPISLNGTAGDDDSNELIDRLADESMEGPEQQVVNPTEEQMITDLLAVLDPRARYAVELRFGLHGGRKCGYREVGEELGVTEQGAGQLVKRAIKAMREYAGSEIPWG